jgi:tail fiber protein gp32
MSLTAANSVITITQPILFPTPQQLQGFGATDVTDMPAVKILEHLMGVDGVLSFGWVFVERMQEITLQADSASNAVMDTINNAQQAIQDAYPVSATIILPGIGLKFSCVNGGLETYKPMPPVQKIYRERKYTFVWNKVTPSLYAG